MKINTLVAGLLIFVSVGASVNASEFRSLFNGQNFDGWKNNGNWVIADDGSIFREKKGGSLVYTAEKVPDDFELRFEWKVGEKSNSGLYYRPTQYEYQILDNGAHNDGKNPRTSAASLYFCIQPSEDATKPVGEWNTGKVICKGTVVQHWLNGKKVIHFDYADPKNAEHVERLRLRGGNLEARGANLSLQDHGDPVWYRGLRMRAIPAGEEIDMEEVTPMEIAPEILEAEKKKLEGIIKRRKEQEAKRQQKADQ
ncbi:MAG: DUF1080 domain-containing protein [Verrucomicrobiota bacterium]